MRGTILKIEADTLRPVVDPSMKRNTKDELSEYNEWEMLVVIEGETGDKESIFDYHHPRRNEYSKLSPRF